MSRKIRKNIILIGVLLLLLMALSGCTTKKESTVTESNVENVEVKNTIIETKELIEKINNDSWVIVDTRINDAYNGWKLEGVKRGGHITGAVDFSANWLRVETEDKEVVLEEALQTKGISPDKNIVLYDANGKDALEVMDYLTQKGYKNLYTYDVKQWAADEGLPMEKYKNYHMIVPASIVKDILDGKSPETFEDAKGVKIVEASWGEEETSYAKGHVPTSIHINTDLIEPPPSWMLASDKELTQFALDYGFSKDNTVIVTGEYTMATYRVAVVLRYMGVKDVRVLNGGLDAWKSAGYEVETNSNKPVPVSSFGTKIPANPHLVDTIEEVKAGLTKSEEFVLVDNRTWEEHIGESSGYSYHDKKGRIPGSVYGYAGKENSNSLQYYRNIDNTMRNGKEILELWEKAGINANKHLSFMCGSGWRVAEILTYANVMGLDDVAIYSNGWIEWSNNPENPIETGEPKK